MYVKAWLIVVDSGVGIDQCPEPWQRNQIVDRQASDGGLINNEGSSDRYPFYSWAVDDWPARRGGFARFPLYQFCVVLQPEAAAKLGVYAASRFEPPGFSGRLFLCPDDSSAIHLDKEDERTPQMGFHY
jgi:hypothetical protein